MAEGRVIAAADAEQLVTIEGNPYFPPTTVDWSMLEASATPYRCPWKGVAKYFSLVSGRSDVAWAYSAPDADAVQRVGRDFSGYIAFDLSIVVVG